MRISRCYGTLSEAFRSTRVIASSSRGSSRSARRDVMATAAYRSRYARNDEKVRLAHAESLSERRRTTYAKEELLPSGRMLRSGMDPEWPRSVAARQFGV